jgi:hypothetical protein
VSRSGKDIEPAVNLLVRHDVLGPHARWRSQVVSYGGPSPEPNARHFDASQPSYTIAMPSPRVTTSRASRLPRRSVTRSAAVAVLLVLFTGCASSPPTPVTSISPLVGKWAGTVAAERGGQQFFYLTLNADQTLVAMWGINWSWGRVTVANGQATYQMTPPPLEGTIRFYQGNGKPTLYLDDLWANFYAVVTKQP